METIISLIWGLFVGLFGMVGYIVWFIFWGFIGIGSILMIIKFIGDKLGLTKDPYE